MEIFLPSLLVIFVSGLIFYFLLPKMSLHVLGLTSVALCVLGVYQHYKTFPYEYNMSHGRQLLMDYAPFIALLLTILALIMGALNMVGGSGGGGGYGGNFLPTMPSMPSMPSMPEMPALPALPFAASLGLNTPAGNKNKGILNLGGNGGKRNNLASNSFKVT